MPTRVLGRGREISGLEKINSNLKTERANGTSGFLIDLTSSSHRGRRHLLSPFEFIYLFISSDKCVRQIYTLTGGKTCVKYAMMGKKAILVGVFFLTKKERTSCFNLKEKQNSSYIRIYIQIQRAKLTFCRYRI